MKANFLTSKLPLLYEIIRYGVVGILNNLLGYLIYLLITYLGLDPKVAITLLYPIGVATAYFGHSKYSFAGHPRSNHTALRYLLAHAIGYAVNFVMLLVLVDHLGYPHQAIQGAAIFVVAGVLFLMFRYFVFPQRGPAATRGSPRNADH